MALTDDILDQQVRHQIGLHRLATGIVHKIIEILEEEGLVGGREEGESRRVLPSTAPDPFA